MEFGPIGVLGLTAQFPVEEVSRQGIILAPILLLNMEDRHALGIPLKPKSVALILVMVLS